MNCLEQAGRQLTSLLQLITLEHEGRPVEVDGVAAGCLETHLRSPAVDYQVLSQVSRFQGPIRLIADQLRSLFSVCVPTRDGQTVPVDGFRLKSAADWTVSEDIIPDVVLPNYSVGAYLSHDCGNDCTFCLHKGDPPGYFTKSGRWQTPSSELWTRVRLYDPVRGRALFPTADYHSYEVLTHPAALSALGAARAKTDRVLEIVTSGNMLTERYVDALVPLMPLFLVVSLNVIDKDERARIMRDNTDVAAESLRLLQDRGIPFGVSIAHPFEDDAGGMADTIMFADQFSPYVIRLNLSGRTRYHRRVQADLRGTWDEIAALAVALRPRVRSPLRIQPALYEETVTGTDPLAPVISGVVPGSPAATAGAEIGDLILRLDDKPVSNRQVAKGFLKSCVRLGQAVRLRVRSGGGREREIELAPGGSGYPYTAMPHTYHAAYPYGLLLIDCLKPASWRHIFTAASRNDAQKVLLITSELMEQSVARMHDLCPPPGNLSIDWIVPRGEFLGGDVCVGDLVTVDDICTAVAEYCQNNERPDLVCVPRTLFSPWRRDLTGKSYREIEQVTGIRTEVIGASVITAMG